MKNIASLLTISLICTQLVYAQGKAKPLYPIVEIQPEHFAEETKIMHLYSVEELAQALTKLAFAGLSDRATWELFLKKVETETSFEKQEKIINE